MSHNADTAKQALIKGFFHQFPGEAALAINSFPTDKVISYLKSLPSEDAIAVFERLSPEVAASVIKAMDETLFVDVFKEVDTYLAARLLLRLDKDTRDAKLVLLSAARSRELKELISYPLDSAGHFMDPGVTTFHPENTVEEVLNRIRSLGDRRIFNVYIIDETGGFLGIVPVQVIAISAPSEKVKNIVQRPIAQVNALSPRSEVVKLLEDHKIIHLPVTDINNKLLGVIRNDELMHATKEQATDDMQTMFGAGKEERALSKVSLGVRKRLPWLQINLATAFLAATVVGLFEETIAQITILAVFLPVVAGQSGNTGSQALAVTMRGLALREFPISQWLRVARKELMVGFLNGIAVALTTSTIVFFWASSFSLAMVIGISMILSMAIAGFSGAVIPIVLKAIGQDPATSSSIILTTVTDVFGFLSFLGLATIFASAIGIAG